MTNTNVPANVYDVTTWAGYFHQKGADWMGKNVEYSESAVEATKYVYYNDMVDHLMYGERNEGKTVVSVWSNLQYATSGLAFLVGVGCHTAGYAADLFHQ